MHPDLPVSLQVTALPPEPLAGLRGGPPKRGRKGKKVTDDVKEQCEGKDGRRRW